MTVLPDLAVAGVAPALLVLVYAVLKTRGGFLTISIWAGLAIGMGCCFSAIAAEFIATRLLDGMAVPKGWRGMIQFFGVVGPIEEGVKLVAILALTASAHRRHAQRILQISVAVGMGFALLENVFYLARSEAWQGLALARASLAVPAHGLFAMAMGALLVRAEIYRDSRGWLVGFAFLLPAILHGAYDFSLVSSGEHDPLVLRLVLDICGLIAIGGFNRALPLAQASDLEAGAPWPGPMRLGCIAVGGIAMVWPIHLLMLAANDFFIGPELRLIALYPAMIAVDLVRSGFTRARPSVSDHRALRI